MKVVRMRKSGKRLQINDRKANLFLRMRVATEEVPVVKKPVPKKPQSAFEQIMDSAREDGNERISVDDALDGLEERMDPQPRKKRRYRRRDVMAEE